ncbi:hypothetical protein Kim5_CH00829 [Rhizobium sp. Kim5]|uniref:hypothetical protein n=1 Tax=Rhizobium sp. Kim5 TaxID=2020311 RepID=UPI0001903667|nr:hypothetical protein [Rhizobium sp. Kim5]ARQ56936.1 hypothetical protein Kim5_CH00829 [Rhizobium sp. Kim5]
MKKELADKLRLEYEHLWHDSMLAVPDGWIDPLVAMLDKLYALSEVDRSMSFDSEGLATWVKIRIEVSSTHSAAYVTPLEPAGEWRPGRALACIDALSEFARQCSKTCSICGLPGAPDGNSMRCAEHAAVEPQVSRSQRLYQEVRDLFPEVDGKAIDLNVPDHLFDLVASTLRSILKVVERYDIVGKVFITKIEMDGEALFVRVRYVDLTYVFLGAQMEINEMISDLEMLSDEATRKHNLGGSDAS